MGLFYQPQLLRANLAYLMERADLNPNSLAVAAKVKQPTVFRILRGESSEPRDSTLRPLAEFFNVPVVALKSVDIKTALESPDSPDAARLRQWRSMEAAYKIGATIAEIVANDPGRPDGGSARDGYVQVPRLNVQVAAGNGIEPSQVEVQSTLAFRQDWLIKKGLSPDQLEVYDAKGDSMSPYIEDGDVLLVDVSGRTVPRNNEIWVLWQDAPFGVRVKRLLYRENGDLIIRSDNSDKFTYPDEIVTTPEMHTVKTVGKVVWRGG